MHPPRLIPILVAVLLVAPTSRAQEGDPPVAPPSLEAVEAAQAAAAAELGALGAADEPASAELRELLTRLDHTLGQHLTELRRAEELELDREQAESALSEPPTAALGEPPYRLATYDEAQNGLERARNERARLERAVASAQTSLETAHSELEALERERRRAKEAGLTDLGPVELRIRIAKALLELRRSELTNATGAQQIQANRLARAEAIDAWVTRHLELGPDDEREALAPYDREEATLRRRLARAELDLQEAKAGWTAAQGRGDDAGLAAQRARIVLHQKEVALLGETIDRLATNRRIAGRRLAVLGAPPVERSELRSWLEEERNGLAELDRDRNLDLAEITTLEQELQEVARRAATPDAPLALSQRAQTLQTQAELHRRNLESLDRTRFLAQRLIGELERSVGGVSLRDRLAGAAERARGVWTYELFQSGDRPITVGKLVIALSLILVGLLLDRWLARLSEQKILPRFGFDAGASHAFAALGFYALLVVIFLISLRMVNIPIGAFALLGGALAIGLGFGSQNVVNNFISGIILLAERPIKIGDLVQVEDTYGNVERIGLRSTRIRTGDNIHFILPNSTFLENRVINWTHNNPKVRIRLDVGVVYGSPTRMVEELLRKTLSEHPRVLPDPTPIVLFTEFGDNSLNFQARFWVSIRSLMDRLRVESELRFRIDDLFREAGIVIAFPQRDVHLDAAAPLEIRLVGKSNGGAAAAE